MFTYPIEKSLVPRGGRGLVHMHSYFEAVTALNPHPVHSVWLPPMEPVNLVSGGC
jgi:hypothetical protein